MSILSDKDIKRYMERDEQSLVIEHWNEENLQPSSVDLHLSFTLKNLDGELFDLRSKDYSLKPHEFILGSTKEYVEVPFDLVGIVEGRSSLGRLGITAHITAGYIDPGFKGNITLEIANVSDKEFILKKDMNICQIIFETLSSPCEKPYGHEDLKSKYQYSSGTILSKYKY